MRVDVCAFLFDQVTMFIQMAQSVLHAAVSAGSLPAFALFSLGHPQA